MGANVRISMCRVHWLIVLVVFFVRENLFWCRLNACQFDGKKKRKEKIESFNVCTTCT